MTSDKSETLRVSAHERLGEVLKAIRQILEKYPKIQSTDLLMTAGNLIQHVKNFNYDDKGADTTPFVEAVDQLAMAFSTRSVTFALCTICCHSFQRICSKYLKYPSILE